MRIRQTLTAAALAAGIGGLIVPALAQNRSGAGNAPDQNMSVGMGRGMGQGMMGGGMMRRGTMSGGCGGMMQPMGRSGRPNSQWQTHRPHNTEPG